MSGLTYSGDHNFWKQRVIKEVFASNTFGHLTNQFQRTGRSGSSGRASVGMAQSGGFGYPESIASNPILMRGALATMQKDTTYSQNYRELPIQLNPALTAQYKDHKTWHSNTVHQLPKSTSAAVLQPSGSKLLARPTTAGSYRAKSRQSVGNQVTLPQSQASSRASKPVSIRRVRPTSGGSQTSSRRVMQAQQIVRSETERVATPAGMAQARSSTHTPVQTPQVVTHSQYDQDPEEAAAQQEQVQFQDVQEEDQPADDQDLASEAGTNLKLPSRPPTSSSWRSSASQKQYIEMLESMLKEERMKRVAIQTQLELTEKSQRSSRASSRK